MQDIDTHLANFRALEATGPAWLRQLREQGLTRFTSLGFPTTRLEDWKYTDISALARTPFRLPPPVAASAPLRQQLAGMTPANGSQLVFINGRYAPQVSMLRSLGTVQVESLATVLTAAPDLVEPYLGRSVGVQGGSFSALNAAFLHDGAVIRVPADVTVDGPIHLLFVSTSAATPTISHPRNLIVAEAGSTATVVERYVGFDREVYCTNAVTEIFVGARARVAHYRLQLESSGAFHVAVVGARQSAESRYSSHVVSLGGALARTEVDTAFDGEGASCGLDGLYMAGGAQHVDHHTSIDHRQPRCMSRELYKGVLDGKARGVFNGKVFVRPDAQGSDAAQTNKNLLLSDSAVIDTKPQLEIFADDVKCSHGATIGQLDDEAIFYLRARGIDAAAARHLLTYAFANELIARMRVESVRTQLEGILRSRLPDGMSSEALA